MKPIWYYRMFVYPPYFFWIFTGIKMESVGLVLAGIATSVMGQLGGVYLMQQLGQDILKGDYEK